jgi:hypothetical protein
VIEKLTELIPKMLINLTHIKVIKDTRIINPNMDGYKGNFKEHISCTKCNTKEYG